MDDADIAGNNTDKFEADAIAAISEASKRRDLVPCGVCHYCQEIVPQHHIFCSSACSLDHRFMTERRKANGL